MFSNFKELLKISKFPLLLFVFFIFSENAKAESDSEFFYAVSEFFEIKENLFKKSNSEELLFGGWRIERIGNDVKSHRVFVNRLGVPGLETPPPKLKDIVDVGSWKQISARLFEDASNVYCATIDSSGAHLNVLRAAFPNELEFYYEKRWVNSRELSYRMRELESKLKIKIELSKNIFSDYVVSRNRVFYKCEEIKDVLASSIHLDQKYGRWAVINGELYEGGYRKTSRELNEEIQYYRNSSPEFSKELQRLKKYIKNKN